MKTVNEGIQDMLIHHSAVDLMKVEATERRKVLEMLRDLERDLITDLVTIDPTAPKRTAYQEKRLQALLKQTQNTIHTYVGDIASVLNDDLVQLAKTEVMFIEKTLNTAFQANVNSVAISSSRLTSLAKDTLIEGANSEYWWKRQTQSMQDKFMREMRMGMLRTETVGQLSKRIRKNVMPVSRRNAEALVRTSMMAVLNESRRESYSKVEHVIKGYKYVATLDTGTTPYCRAADGTIFRKNYKVAKGPSWVKPPPNHWQCRSIISPITKSWEELKRQFKGAKKSKELDPVPTETRAAMDGKAPRDQRYTEWLRGQSVSLQKEVLGVTRYRLFKAGKIKNMTQLLDQSGNRMTIPQLQEAIKKGNLVEETAGKLGLGLSKKGRQIAAITKRS